jgi:antirestriction protein ArdC
MSQLNDDALMNARGRQSTTNYGAIFQGFAAMGIDNVQPRGNVLTFKAWLALGRVVKKGQHGVKVVTFVPMAKNLDDGGTKGFLAPRTTTVFHISQTEAIQ